MNKTDAELVWAAYRTSPSKGKTWESYEQMSEEAKDWWLKVAKRRLNAGELFHIPQGAKP